MDRGSIQFPFITPSHRKWRRKYLQPIVNTHVSRRGSRCTHVYTRRGTTHRESAAVKFNQLLAFFSLSFTVSSSLPLSLLTFLYSAPRVSGAQPDTLSLDPSSNTRRIHRVVCLPPPPFLPSLVSRHVPLVVASYARADCSDP